MRLFSPDHSSTSLQAQAAPTCGLCGCQAISPLLEATALRVGKCKQCGSTLVLAATECRDPDSYATSYELELQQGKASLCWGILEKLGLDRSRKVLDIGCGRGDFLDLASGAGCETSGIEQAESSAAEARRRGHRVIHGSVPEVPPPVDQTFDLVVMWDILEHLSSPGRALASTFPALVPGGHLVIVTPTLGTVFDRGAIAMHRLSAGRLQQLTRMCWSHEHLFRFDAQGLVRVLLALGFRRASAERLQLLSLKTDRYAGGRVLPNWTRDARINRVISSAGVAVVRALRLHNKVLVVAQKAAAS